MAVIATNVIVINESGQFPISNCMAFSVFNTGSVDLKLGPQNQVEIPVKSGQSFVHGFGDINRHKDATWEIKFEAEGGQAKIVQGIIESQTQTQPTSSSNPLIQKISELIDTIKMGRVSVNQNQASGNRIVERII